jgi:hypothetical protein
MVEEDESKRHVKVKNDSQDFERKLTMLHMEKALFVRLDKNLDIMSIQNRILNTQNV